MLMPEAPDNYATSPNKEGTKITTTNRNLAGHRLIICLSLEKFCLWSTLLNAPGYHFG